MVWIQIALLATDTWVLIASAFFTGSYLVTVDIIASLLYFNKFFVLKYGTLPAAVIMASFEI